MCNIFEGDYISVNKKVSRRMACFRLISPERNVAGRQFGNLIGSYHQSQKSRH